MCVARVKITRFYFGFIWAIITSYVIRHSSDVVVTRDNHRVSAHYRKSSCTRSTGCSLAANDVTSSHGWFQASVKGGQRVALCVFLKNCERATNVCLTLPLGFWVRCILLNGNIWKIWAYKSALLQLTNEEINAPAVNHSDWSLVSVWVCYTFTFLFKGALACSCTDLCLIPVAASKASEWCI